MKKILLIGICILLILSWIVIDYKSTTTLSPEVVIEEVLSNIFTVPYCVAEKEYQIRFKDSGAEDDIDKPDYIYRDEIFQKYFTQDKYHDFTNKIYNLLYHPMIRQYKFDLVFNSSELDIRDTYDKNVKTCYFTVTYEIDFLDDARASIIKTTDGELTVIEKDNTWLIGTIKLRLETLDLNK